MRKNMRKKQLICMVIFLVIFIFLYTINVTTSRYLVQTSATKENIVALPVLTLSNNEQNINITDIKPGDTKEYTFSVSNSDGGNINEVLLKYTLNVEKSQESVANSLASDNILTFEIYDSNNQKIELGTQEIEMGYKTGTTTNITKNYKLKVRWDTNQKSNINPRDSKYAKQQLKYTLKLVATQVTGSGAGSGEVVKPT